MRNTTIPTAVPAHHLPPPSHSEAMSRMIDMVARFEWPEVMPTSNASWAELRNPNPQATRERNVKAMSRLNLKVDGVRYGDVDCYRIDPVEIADGSDVMLVYFHGGGYVMGAGEAGIHEAILIAGATRLTTVSVDYRMPPEHPYPAPLDDALNAWMALVAAFPGRKFALIGSSAGASLAMCLIQKLVEAGLPKPSALIAGTPWSDLTETGDSYFTNKFAEPMEFDGMLSVFADQFTNGIDHKDPRVSPVYGSFLDFPPTMLITGTRDLFLSNTVRVDRKIRDAGGVTELIVYEGQSHVQYMMDLDIPETKTTLDDINKFVRRYLLSC